MSEQTGIEVWRGGVNTWECDEMGHMNVRFYVAKAMEGVAGLAAAMGMPAAFTANANATLIVRDIHVRFLREAHAGTLLTIEGGVAELDETQARLVLIMRHRDGAPAATFQISVVHATRLGEAFPWPAAALAKVEGLRVQIPEAARPRSIDIAPFKSQASLVKADELGLGRIGLGVIGPQDCDVFGRMRPEVYIGRVSDGAAFVVGAPRAAIIEHAEQQPARVGGAVLELHQTFTSWPRAGQRFELRSGVLGAQTRTFEVIHWLLDPDTGAPLGSALAVVAAFDLDARKLVAVTDAAREAVAVLSIPGLSR
ncbi:thioesterase family protein [Caulobacter sp. 73W]|uniref:Thioesterase family protein n=1 Tax=Caulobacter sp. 73W TaxID=3161137 RepID=A0AB39KPC1_9CAUL